MRKKTPKATESARTVVQMVGGALCRKGGQEGPGRANSRTKLAKMRKELKELKNDKDKKVMKKDIEAGRYKHGSCCTESSQTKLFSQDIDQQ